MLPSLTQPPSTQPLSKGSLTQHLSTSMSLSQRSTYLHNLLQLCLGGLHAGNVPERDSGASILACLPLGLCKLHGLDRISGHHLPGSARGKYPSRSGERLTRSLRGDIHIGCVSQRLDIPVGGFDWEVLSLVLRVQAGYSLMMMDNI